MLLVVDFQGSALSKLLLGDGEILLQLVESEHSHITLLVQYEVFLTNFQSMSCRNRIH